MKWLKNIFKGCLKNGLTVGYSTGKMFDPTDQVRTSPYDDFKNKEKKIVKHKIVFKKKGE